MKIEQIRLAWFRGAAEEIPFLTESKSVVIYGPNGAGKSSFVDAFEYVIRNGKINHLAHEYSGRRLENAVRNSHAPADIISTIYLQFEGGPHVNVSIDASGIADFQPDCDGTLELLQQWKPNRVILRQDEVANFIHATKGEKYSVLLPLLGLETAEQAAINLHSLGRQIIERSELNEKQKRASELEKQAKKVLKGLSKDRLEQVQKELSKTYLSTSTIGLSSPDLLKIKDKIEKTTASLDPEIRRHQLLTLMGKEDLPNKLRLLRNAEESVSKIADEFLKQRVSVLTQASDFIEHIDTSGEEETILCPACGQTVKKEVFAKHVEEELNKLRNAQKSLKVANSTRHEFVNSRVQVLRQAKESEVNDWLKLEPQKNLQALLSHLGSLELPEEGGWSPKIMKVLDELIPSTHALLAEAVKEVPPKNKHLIDDMETVKILLSLPEINKLNQQIVEIDALVEWLSNCEGVVRSAIITRTSEILAHISTDIRRLWSKLHPGELIEEVQLYVPGGEEKAIDISLKFFGVEHLSPRIALSEGHRNSLGLCIFISLVLFDSESSCPVVMDDIVSSLDREHRGFVVDVLIDELADRQILLFTHDREWYSELRRRLSHRHYNFKVLRPWEKPSEGIRWSQSVYGLEDARALRVSNPEAAGNTVRRYMDSELAEIAEKLRINLPYLRGERNDQRMAAELLEAIISNRQNLKKRVNGEYEVCREAEEIWREVLLLIVTWGDRSSHTGTLTPLEVDRFIDKCEAAIKVFWCDNCGDPVWIAHQETRERLQCSCGGLQWRYE